MKTHLNTPKSFPMAQSFVIIELPTTATMLSNYIVHKDQVRVSVGPTRDLSKSARSLYLKSHFDS